LMPARSEGHAYPYAPPPDHTAFLSDLAVEKLEALGQIDHRKYFEAGPARGVIDQSAGNRRQPRAHDDLGLACLRTRGPNALIEPRELAFRHAAMVPACRYRPLKVRWLKWPESGFDNCYQGGKAEARQPPPRFHGFPDNLRRNLGQLGKRLVQRALVVRFVLQLPCEIGRVGSHVEMTVAG